jgi:hypothetical protein
MYGFNLLARLVFLQIILVVWFFAGLDYAFFTLLAANTITWCIDFAWMVEDTHDDL